MSLLRPNQLPPASTPLGATDKIVVDQGAGGVNAAEPLEVVDAAIPVPSQAVAEAGADNNDRMTSLRTKQSIASEVGVTIASRAQGDLADSAVQSINGITGTSITLAKADIGLGNVDNTSDLNKPISTATQSALDLKANISALPANNRLVPTGGITGQVLAKNSNTDYDTEWTAVGAGDMLTSVYDPSSIASNAFNGFPVPTRTALKALDTSVFTSVSLTETGRSGGFVWSSGDYSAQVAADTTEAIYIKADAVAATSGAWVRQYDGFNLPTRWTGGDWQASYDIAWALGIPTITPTEHCTRTAATGPLKVRPGVTLHSFSRNKILTMENGAQLTSLLDFATYSANDAKVFNIIIDGNRANNADDISSKHMILVYDTHDVTIEGCVITGSNGNGILVRDGFRAKILKNSISNVFVLPIAISRTTKVNSFHEVCDNTISGEWGQHGIVVRYANYCVIRRNNIAGQRFGTFTINITGGNTIVSQSGNYFTPASVGKFIIFNGGIERLISAYVNPTTVVVSVGGLTGTGLTAAWGNGDVISVEGSDDCDISENIVNGSASLGISVFSNASQGANRNRVYKNRVGGHGSAGISIQATSPNYVLSTYIEGNIIVDCGQNRGAGDSVYNVGISVQGGTLTQRVAVIGGSVDGYIAPPTMNYGIAFGSTVVNKFYSGVWIAGCVSNTVQNP